MPRYLGDRGPNPPPPPTDPWQEPTSLVSTAGCLNGVLVALAVLSGIWTVVIMATAPLLTDGIGWALLLLAGVALHIILLLVLAFYLRGLGRCVAWLVRDRLAEKTRAEAEPPADEAQP